MKTLVFCFLKHVDLQKQNKNYGKTDYIARELYNKTKRIDANRDMKSIKTLKLALKKRSRFNVSNSSVDVVCSLNHNVEGLRKFVSQLDRYISAYRQVNLHNEKLGIGYK